MIPVLRTSWPLFLGMYMLMMGNGLQSTLLGIRGGIENFSSFHMSIVMSGYFAGFLIGSRITPELIRRVGHIRVFAALGSTVSAVLILYPVLVDVWAWSIGRVVIGLCISGVYITAESWLNNASTNETRGQALSVYMVVQMAGIITAQYVVSLGDASGFVLFIIPSMLVSLAFAPILLSVQPTPASETTRRMRLRDLIDASPLAAVGMACLGVMFAAMFGMVAVYGAEAGLSADRTSLLVSVMFAGSLVAQFPIGWLSDRMDRRILIIAAAATGGLGGLIAAAFGGNYYLLLTGAALVGGMTNPLYSLLLAYANDFLEHEDMPSASAGFIFINGMGAIFGPLVMGYAMGRFGAFAIWAILGLVLSGLSVYGMLRVLQRPSDFNADEVTSYAPVTPAGSPVAVEAAQEFYIETELEEQQSDDPT